MAKEPRATDTTTPKKRVRKPQTEGDNGIQIVKAAATTAPKSKKTKEVAIEPPVEERIRIAPTSCICYVKARADLRSKTGSRRRRRSTANQWPNGLLS